MAKDLTDQQIARRKAAGIIRLGAGSAVVDLQLERRIYKAAQDAGGFVEEVDTLDVISILKNPVTVAEANEHYEAIAAIVGTARPALERSLLALLRAALDAK